MIVGQTFANFETERLMFASGPAPSCRRSDPADLSVLAARVWQHNANSPSRIWRFGRLIRDGPVVSQFFVKDQELMQSKVLFTEPQAQQEYGIRKKFSWGMTLRSITWHFPVK